jgi:hypothetical protein
MDVTVHNICYKGIRDPSEPNMKRLCLLLKDGNKAGVFSETDVIKK